MECHCCTNSTFTPVHQYGCATWPYFIIGNRCARPAISKLCGLYAIIHHSAQKTAKAEASRFTELRTYLESELQSLKTQNTETHQQVEVRLAETEAAVKAVVEETGRTLSAYIGELEDRLEKK